MSISEKMKAINKKNRAKQSNLYRQTGKIFYLSSRHVSKLLKKEILARKSCYNAKI